MLTIYVIYDHPQDYPDNFVVRTQTPDKNGAIAYGLPTLCDTLTEARQVVPPGLYRLPRMPGDDVHGIVECWL